MIKALLKKTPVYDIYQSMKPKPDYDPFDYVFKRKVIMEYAQRFQLRTFIETGTCEGGTVAALHEEFDQVYSIELDELLASNAQERFKDLDHVTILQGDSADHLPGILRDLQQPALFWLDAHFSGTFENEAGDLVHTARGETDTPLQSELETILADSSVGHIVLIDDARELGRGDYPTFRALKRICGKAQPAYEAECAKDIVRITPR